MDFSDLIIIKIKEIMKEKNMSAYKLANVAGIYQSTLSSLLTRKTKTIRLENLLYICEALDIKLAEFFSDKRFEEIEAKEWLNKNL